MQDLSERHVAKTLSRATAEVGLPTIGKVVSGLEICECRDGLGAGASALNTSHVIEVFLVSVSPQGQIHDTFRSIIPMD